ncbi:MAG: hypothetical protein RIR18_299 [Pseudomonadota bacterium]
MDQTNLKKAAALIDYAKSIAILTGAGMSAESGIPTFRDTLTGLWSNFDPEELANRRAFVQDKELVWGWYEWRRMMVLKAEPNPGHLAIAKLAEQKPCTVITQNVDDLHERAGSKSVFHLHGSLHQPRCLICGAPFVFPPEIPEEPEGGRRLPPPECGECDGYIRPGVVWFGEELPQDVWHKSVKAISQCDLLLTIGTSSLVQPAASLPNKAKSLGKPIIVINPSYTEHERIANITLHGKAGEVLPQLIPY